ncbi:MAG: diguanylate cyclase [Candidatus Woesearchaeota archaeon]
MSEIQNEKLSELIDLEAWKRIQDKFSEIVNVPIQTLDTQGNIIYKSKEFPFFLQIVLHKKAGAEKCHKCRVKALEELRSKEDNIHMYYCHTGLFYILVPIALKGKQVGAISAGPIIRNEPNVHLCRRVAEEIGVEAIELIDASRELRVHDKGSIEKIGTLLYSLSQTIPGLMHEKHTTERKVSTLTILHKISQLVNSTLNLDEILNSILNFMKNSVNAQNSSVFIFEENLRMAIEKLPDSYLLFENKIAEEMKLKETFIMIKNIESDPHFKGLATHQACISFPLRLKEEIIGMITLYGEGIKLSDEDLELLNTITNQAATAIQNARQYKKISELATIDPLTKIFNRRKFMEVFDMEVERAKKFDHYLSVVLLDIDDFGHYNNTHGHLAGDQLLKEFARILKENTTSVDIVARYGGEEFIIVLPALKPAEAKNIAEKIRKIIEETYFEGEEMQPLGRVTASFGVATSMDKTLTKEELIREADKALYKSKAAGKNKVTGVTIVNRNLSRIES